MDVTQLVEAADLVLTAQVREQRVVQTPSGRVDTEFTLDVERTFWGEERGERIIRLPGGVLPDGSGMLIPGMPSLRVGQEVLLSLSRASSENLRMPIGLAQGCFHLVQGPDGRRMAQRSNGGLGLRGEPDDPGSCGSGHFSVDYGELVGEVVRAVEERKARGEEGGQ